MYLSFYGLSEKPFNLTPDAGFVYLSQIHREVLGHLLFGINNRKGFICITGEVGSGKTTLCRVLLNQLDENTEVAFVLNSYLTEFELLKTINEDLGIATTGRTRKELIDELNRYLIEQNSKGKNIIVIIDEAQNLSIPVLEQLRMLSNLETEKEKLLQIILVGQPELNKLLQNEKIRQLNQRITVRHHLTPLTKDELKEYIYHRLNIAGSKGNIVFTEGAIGEIFRFSRGIPRAINVICDQALLVGYVMNSLRITKAMIRKAVCEVLGNRNNYMIKNHLRRNTIASRTAVGFVMVALVIFGYLSTIKYIKLSNEQINTSVVSSTLHNKDTIPDSDALVFGDDNNNSSENNTKAESINSNIKNNRIVSSETDSDPVSNINNKTLPENSSSLLLSALGSGAGNIIGKKIESSYSSIGSSSFSDKEKENLKTSDVVLDEMPGTTKLDATIDLLRMWKIEEQYLRAVKSVSDGITVEPDKAAKASGMGYVILNADIDTLKKINIPAIVQLKLKNSSLRYVAIKSISESTVTVVSLSKEYEIEIEKFRSSMTGETTIFCNDTFVNPAILKSDMEMSIDVRKLQEYLKKLGYFNGNCSGWFTSETEEAVMKFQSDNKLRPSGEVEGYVKILLYSLKNRDSEIPRLLY